MQPAPCVAVQTIDMPLQVCDEFAPVVRAFLRGPDRIQFKPQAANPERAPERRAPDDEFGIDVRPGVAKCLDTVLVELPVQAVPVQAVMAAVVLIQFLMH